MSLKETHSTKSWNTIPKICKTCIRAIFTKEDNEVYYQCSLHGKFKKDCTVKINEQRTLPKAEEVKNY